MADRNLYFAKVNLNSHIYELYDGEVDLNYVGNKILSNVNENAKFIDKVSYDGDVVYTAEYEFYNIEKNIEKKVIYGWILKKADIFINKINKDSNETKKIAVPNDEAIKFYYDIDKETIIFHTTQRYGYIQFCNSFEGLLNKCMQDDGYKFSVSLRRENYSITDMRKKLSKVRGINYLKINVIPPNPNEKILENMKMKGKKIKEEYKKGNLTGICTIFSSSTPTGMDINAKPVRDGLDFASYLDSELEENEGVSKGYTEIEVRTQNGSTYSTKDSSPISVAVDEDSLADIFVFQQVCAMKMAKFIANNIREA